MLALAIILISLALAFYTLGVWAERRTGELRWWHVAAFAAGLTADVSGTVVMTMIANGGGATGVEQSPVLAQLMAATGLVALLLMALHLGWAVVTMIRDRFDEKRVFHRFSIVVWVIWLIPYFTGMAAAMA
ncbi:MAG TPA: HsmA family protein [Propionicimonas sp.]|nr:HsmA family protein [Propionicimonas sp.]HQA78136.1 HsmA family protein [Propionicimonas sp.]HQD98043.1 HsmA family protein [Propionicimonas sp.]